MMVRSAPGGAGSKPADVSWMGMQGIVKWTQQGAQLVQPRCNGGVYFFDDYKDEYGCLYIQASTNIP